MDINDASPSPQTDLTITTGLYSVGTDKRGQLTLITSGGAQHFDFSLGSISAGVGSFWQIINPLGTLSTVRSAACGVFTKTNISASTLTHNTSFFGDFSFLF